MPGGLLTDLYELNMAASYLRRGMDEPATFSLFVRKLPSARGFLVAAGLGDCLDYLERFGFDEPDMAWLQGTLGFEEDTIDRFRAMRFTGDVWAVPEGRVALAGEPLLEVTAPLPEAQLVETYLLNQLTYQTAIASKAARCRIAAGPADVVDFAMRRTHGIEASLAVARVSAIVGFSATSNVEAARRYGLVAAGTMAHSYIEAFGSQLDAFRAFAADLPARTTFLVDTYDTLDGVRDAIRVIRELGLTGNVGVRLDSGDLAALAHGSRRILDDEGMQFVKIFASGGLDELEIDEILRSGAPVDAFGVGTRMGVSADAPYLDSAYKLVAYAGRPVMKLSTGKQTSPAAKQVFRSPGLRDVIGLRDEPPPPDAEPLLVQVMAAGLRTGRPDTIDAARGRFERDLAEVPPEALALRDPKAPEPATSERLSALSERVRAELMGLRGDD